MALYRILKSLCITLAITTGLTLCLWWIGFNFWKTFFLIFTLHFFLFGIINYFTGIYMNYKMRLVETDQLRLLENQSVIVNCARCGEPTAVPILLGEDNLYKCDRCGATNTVIISAEAALTTTPVETIDPRHIIEKKLDESKK
jgi:hypothetical protein